MLRELKSRRAKGDDRGGAEDTGSAFDAVLSETVHHLDGQLSDVAGELVRVLHLANQLDEHLGCHWQSIVTLEDQAVLVALYQGVGDSSLGVLLGPHIAGNGRKQCCHQDSPYCRRSHNAAAVSGAERKRRAD